MPAALAPARPAVPEGHADVPHARRADRAHRPPCRRGRDRAPARHRRRPDRSRRRRLAPRHVGGVDPEPTGRRRHRLRAGRRSSRTGRAAEIFSGDLLHASDYRNPEPFTQPRRARRRPGVLGHGDRLRPRRGWRGEGLAVRAHAAEHPAAPGPGGLPGDAIGAALLHLPVRIADAMARVRATHGPGRPDRVRASGSRGGRVRATAAARRRAGDRRPGGHRGDQGAQDRDRARRRRAGRRRRAAGRRRPDRARRRHLRDRLPACARAACRPSRRAERARRAARCAGAAGRAGLRFIGYVPRPGMLGYMGKEAKRAAKAIARELRGAPDLAVREPIAAA